MILCALDFETTGLSPDADRVIEVGAILYSTTQNRCLESAGFLVKTDLPITEEILNVTGIHPAALKKFGFESKDGLENLVEMMNMSEALVGQNISRFDMRFLKLWGERDHIQIPDKLVIDTRTDLPGVEGKHLGYMAADAGFLNLFPHSALSDCQTVLKLVSLHPIEKIVERAKSPTLVLLGKQDRSENHLAKERKFRWNPNFKFWWKAIKEMDLEEESKAPFEVVLAPKEVLLEQLWFD